LDRLFKYTFQENSEVTAKKTIEIQKKSKRFKEELRQVLDSKRGATRGSPKSLQKRKNTFKVGEGSKQWRKSGKDVKLQKIMRRSTRPIGVTTPKVVTRHIPSKSQKDHSSEHDQKRREQP
jgi:hypothetical protein